MNGKEHAILGWVSGILLMGCLASPTEETPPPTGSSGPPALVHSVANLVVVPGIPVTESLYVRDSVPGAWIVALTQAPTGTSHQAGIVRYAPPEGIGGTHSVRALASHADGRLLEAEWTVTIRDSANKRPEFVRRPRRAWIVAGEAYRETVTVRDPDGEALAWKSNLPAGAAFQDSVLEWTPTREQAGVHFLYFTVTDSWGGQVYESFRLDVLAQDPRPLSAELTVGRAWWIRGYHVKESFEGRRDSVTLRRQVRILSVDSAVGAFTFRLLDTLGEGAADIRDSVYQGSRAYGHPLGIGDLPLPEALPFDWSDVAPMRIEEDFALGARVFPGIRLIQPNTCLNGGGSKFGCGGWEVVHVPVWGRMRFEELSKNHFSATTVRSSFSVQAVGDP